MKNYFIIHGAYGSPFKHWIPWLENRLVGSGFMVTVPTFPTPLKQEYRAWESVMEVYLDLGYISEDTVIITHSLGGIFTIKFLIEHDVKISKLITVAAFDNLVVDSSDNSAFDSFYIEEEKLGKLKELSNERVSIYSSNDQFVPVSKAEVLANKIGAIGLEIPDAGHFTKSDGYTEFDKILEYI